MPLPTRPIPATWPLRPSSHVFSTDMNSQVRDAIKYLARPPAFYGQQQTTSQSIGNTGNVDVLLDLALIDNYGGFSDAGQKKYTVPSNCGGLYLAFGAVSYSSAATNRFGCDIAVNGTAAAIGSRVPSTTGAQVTAGDFDILPVSGGDHITLQAFQNTAGSVNLANGVTRFPFLYLQWIALDTGTGTPGLTVPTARTWATNDVCTSAGSNSAGHGSFNVEIRNSENFLAFPPVMRAVTSSSQSGIVTATDTQITGLSSTIDNYSALSANTWTVPVNGLYIVGAQTSWVNASQASYATEVQCKISGVTTLFQLGSVQGQTNTTLTAWKIFRFSAGDTVQLFGRQNSGGNLSTTSGIGDSRLMSVWMGN